MRPVAMAVLSRRLSMGARRKLRDLWPGAGRGLVPDGAVRRPLGSRKVSSSYQRMVSAGAGLTDEVEDVGAAAEDDVLGVDGLVEGGVVVGVGAAADVGAAFEESDFCAGAGEGDGGGEAGYACAHDDDVAVARRSSRRLRGCAVT